MTLLLSVYLILSGAQGNHKRVFIMITLLHFPPALILIAGAGLLFFAKKQLYRFLLLLLPVLALTHVWLLRNEAALVFDFFGYTLTPFANGPYTLIFATVFCLVAFAGALFGLNQSRKTELAAAFLYAGSALGVCFAGDLISLFVFWEIMALGSTLVIWSNPGIQARAAGLRYALLHFAGGAVLMAGITAHAYATGSIALPHLVINGGGAPASAWLMLAGILINAAAPPLSAWLTDAYPQSSYSGMVFLSAFTTKTAVFVLLNLFYGSQVLIGIGLFMAFYGIVYAIMEDDMRRLLAYGIINQVGFMLAGVGIGSELAMLGVAAHAFSHVLYKALLLTSAGSVLYMTGHSKCRDLGGLYRSMPYTAVMGIVGVLAMSAPLTTGFASKSLLLLAVHDYSVLMGLALIAVAAATFAFIGVKFFWLVFFHKENDLTLTDPPLNMRLAMGFLAVLCIVPGLLPQFLYSMLPHEVDYQPNTMAHFITQAQLMLFAGLFFAFSFPWLIRLSGGSTDFDWLYRVLVTNFLTWFEKRICSLLNRLSYLSGFVGKHTSTYLLQIYGTRKGLSRARSIGTSALWIGMLLGGYLLLYYRA